MIDAGIGSIIGCPFSFNWKVTAAPDANTPEPDADLNVLYLNQSSTTAVNEVDVLADIETILQHIPDVAPAIQSPTCISRPLYSKSFLVKWEPCACAVTVPWTVHW